MSLLYKCRCGRSGQVADKYSGETIACPACKGPVQLPPPAPPVSVDSDAPKPLRDSGAYEVMHLLGMLIIVFAGWVGISSASQYPSERFQSDNAYGAAANSLEDIQIHLSAWGWAFLGVSMIICAKLSRLIHILQARSTPAES